MGDQFLRSSGERRLRNPLPPCGLYGHASLAYGGKRVAVGVWCELGDGCDNGVKAKRVSG